MIDIPPIKYRECPEIVFYLLKKKENGQKRTIIHNKELAYLLLETDKPWNTTPVPTKIILQSLRLLRCAQLFPPDGYETEELSCSRGMSVAFTREGVKSSS